MLIMAVAALAWAYNRFIMIMGQYETFASIMFNVTIEI